MPILPDIPIGNFLQRVMTTADGEAVRSDLNAVQWKTFASDHKINDLSMENGWLGLCIAATTDNIEPQDDGVPSNLVGLSPLTPNVFAGVVRVIHEVSFTKPGYLTELNIWPAKVGDEVGVAVALINDTTNKGEVFALPPLVADQWNRISLPRLLVTAGDDYRFIMETIDYGVSAVINGGWAKLNAVGGTPGSGQYSIDGSATTLRISETDLDGVSRATELSGLVSGSTFSFVETAQADRSATYTATGAVVDSGTYITIPVIETSVGAKGNPRDLQACSCTFSTSAATNTNYDSLPAHFATPPTWGTAVGVVDQNGVETSRGTTAYGIDFSYQPLIASPDWTLLSSPHPS